jgi:hypothetical protein
MHRRLVPFHGGVHVGALKGSVRPARRSAFVRVAIV